MIDVKQIYEDQMLSESSGQRIRHVFENGDLTFADMRDIFTKVFSGDIEMDEKVDGVPLMVTFKDGKFCCARDVKSLKKPVCYADVDAEYCKAPKELAEAIANSLKDLDVALSEIDPVALNRYFANGQNFLNCQIVYPPCANVIDYGNKCFIVFDCLKCYNDKFKEIGEDKDSAEELFELLRKNGALQQETFELTKPVALKIKNTTSAREALAKVLEKLGEFINGVGWKCSLNQFVQDKYSRHIVNKALDHGIDVSRTSDFVNALAQRLSQVSGRKPTKSDLITYAKCDGVNYRDPEYKAFVQELEDNCDATNAEIIKPVEDLIMWAGDILFKNITGFMAADPSKSAKKLYAQVQDAVSEGEGEDASDRLTQDGIARFKKNLARIDQYQEMAPTAGIVIMWKGRPYKMTGKFGPVSELLNIVKYK